MTARHTPPASRRDFLLLLGRGAVWATAAATVTALLRYLAFTEPVPPQVFVLDTPQAYPPGTTTPVAEGQAFIRHDRAGLYAINATCTHLGCLVKQVPLQMGFECPCHDSHFLTNGAVIRGPATLPLNHAALSLDSAGRLVLDLGQTVGAEVRLPSA
jgi:nitrite reductase/ring-hydroxylating ferredoxin subunit